MTKWGWLCWGALALLVACGGGTKHEGLDGGSDAGVPDAGPTTPAPSITTTSLPDAVAGGDYAATVTAAGGQPPLAWSLKTVSSNLSHLTIDQTNGTISGQAGTVTGQGSLTVQVTDSVQRSATADYNINVGSCQDGQTHACSASNGTVCFEGSQACQGGAFGTCTSTGTPSTDVNNCGSNCGSCGNAGDHCAAGACACGDGGTACSGQDSTCCAGGCTDPKTDVANCGSCGNACPAAPAGSNAAAECASGNCDLACNPEYANCNSPDGGSSVLANDIDGCETHLPTDTLNCGACGNACPVGANVAQATCDNSTCGAICTQPYKNCDNNLSNGCEANVTNDVNNCGACGHICLLHDHETANQCVNQTCQTNTCTQGYADCKNGEVDGCETDIFNDPSNCGTCGNVCAGPTAGSGWPICNGQGQCDIQCQNGSSLCGTACRSLETDPNNCGACGKVCPGPTSGTGSATCSNGTCGITCAAGQTLCGTSCADLDTNHSNCGACGRACGGGVICDMGSCCDTTCVGGSNPICTTCCTDVNGQKTCTQL